MIHHRSNQTKGRALDLGSLTGTGSRKNSVGQKNKSDLFQFSLANRSSFSASLTNLKANADLKLLNGSKAELATSTERGKQPEQITLTLEPGTYYIKVNVVKKGATPFALSYSATPISSSPAPGASSPAPGVGQSSSGNSLSGRTEFDYAVLVNQAQTAAFDFYDNGNALGYNRFNAINDTLRNYALQGDTLALEYYKQALDVETFAATVASTSFF